MYRSASQEFISTIRNILQSQWILSEDGGFLILDRFTEVSPDNLTADKAAIPPARPLTDACQLIICQAKQFYLENIIFGINEIYKAYLQKINSENQQQITDAVVNELELIFIYVTGSEFPFGEKVWEWLCASAKPVGLYLLKNNFLQGAFSFLEFMSRLGKRAARKNLSTGALQHVFRILELKAVDLEWEELNLKIKNLRQNLEC